MPPLISRISSLRPPFILNLNAGTFLRGPKNASAPSTGSADQWRKSVPARSRFAPPTEGESTRGFARRYRRGRLSRDASAFAPRSTCCFDRDYTASTLSPPRSHRRNRISQVRRDRCAAAVVAAAIDASVATEYAPMRHALSPPRHALTTAPSPMRSFALRDRRGGGGGALSARGFVLPRSTRRRDRRARSRRGTRYPGIEFCGQYAYAAACLALAAQKPSNILLWSSPGPPSFVRARALRRIEQKTLCALSNAPSTL